MSGPGEIWACAGAFPGIISAQKMIGKILLAYASTVKATEGGANTLPGKATGKGEKASHGAALEGGYAAGTAAAGFAQVEECAVELAGCYDLGARPTNFSYPSATPSTVTITLPPPATAAPLPQPPAVVIRFCPHFIFFISLTTLRHLIGHLTFVT